jgi:hypothetical protein
MQIGCEEAVLARLSVPLKSSPQQRVGTPLAVGKRVALISAYLTALLLTREPVASTRCFLPPCHPRLRCVVWFETSLHFLGFLCQWSFSLRARQMEAGQQYYPCWQWIHQLRGAKTSSGFHYAFLAGSYRLVQHYSCSKQRSGYLKTRALGYRQPSGPDLGQWTGLFAAGALGYGLELQEQPVPHPPSWQVWVVPGPTL